MARVFISYSHDDAAGVAEHLFKRLQGAGYEVWKDDHSLGLGDHFATKIYESITTQDYVVVLLSPAGLASRWVKEEIETAKVNNRHLIPILLEEVEVPPNLGILHYLKMFDGEKDWRALHKLVDNLHEGKNIPRVFNASGYSDIEVKGALILGESAPVSADLNDQNSVAQIAGRLAQEALPYIKEVNAGIITPGHPAIALTMLANLLGWYNQMPKLYWTSRTKEGKFGIDAERYISLQDVRDEAKMNVAGVSR